MSDDRVGMDPGVSPALGRRPRMCQRCASPGPRRSRCRDRHIAALKFRGCRSRRRACWQADPVDLQARLAVAHLGGAATSADAHVAAGWDEDQASRAGRNEPPPGLLRLVPSSSQASDEVDATFLGIAGGPVLAGSARCGGRQARADCRSRCRRRSRRSPSLRRHHRHANVLLLCEKRMVTRERRSSSRARARAWAPADRCRSRSGQPTIACWVLDCERLAFCAIGRSCVIPRVWIRTGRSPDAAGVQRGCPGGGISAADGPWCLTQPPRALA